nr:hypothetical protein [Tanacetum cinerariifolium]
MRVYVQMESSATREYSSLIHTFFLTHTVGGIFLNPADKALYDEMLSTGSRLQHPLGRAYTEDEIMAIVREGKQQGHILSVGRILSGQDTVIPTPPPCTHSSDVAKLKKREKLLTKKVNMFMKLFRSDDKFSKMLTQLKSQPEYSGGSGRGGCGDDEPGDDEYSGEDGEDEDDNPDTGKLYVSRDVVFDEEKAWVWEKSTKIKATPGMSFTVEGFNHEEPFEDEFDPESSSPLSGSSHGSPQVDSSWSGESQPISSPLNSQPSPQSNTPPVTHESPTTPNSPITSPSTASSSTGGGAPKRFRLLTDLYNQTEEIELLEELMMIQSNEEPVTYAEANYDHGSFGAFLSYEAKHRNSDCGTESWSDNIVGSPHGFIIHWIVISKNIKKVTEVIDVKNWRVDNSRVSKWIVSLVELNSSVSSTKSSIQGTFRYGVYTWRKGVVWNEEWMRGYLVCRNDFEMRDLRLYL